MRKNSKTLRMLSSNFHLAGLSHTSNKNQAKNKKETLFFLHQDPPPQIFREVSYKPSHTIGKSHSTGLHLWMAGEL